MATVQSSSISIYGYRTDNYYNKITGYIRWTYTYTSAYDSLRFRIQLTKIDFVVTSQSTGEWVSNTPITIKNQLKYMRVRNDTATATYPTQSGSSTLTWRNTSSTRQISLKATGWEAGDTISIFSSTDSQILQRQPSGSSFSSTFGFSIQVASTSSTQYTNYITCIASASHALVARTVSEVKFSANHPVFAASEVTTPTTKNITINSTLSDPGECTPTVTDGVYNFIGWFTDSNCTNQVSFPLTIEAWPFTRTLYGGWRATSIGTGESIPPQIIKTGIWKAKGTVSTIPFSRANAAYSFVHTDNTMGFIEINNETAKIYNGAIEANQFYEI